MSVEKKCPENWIFLGDSLTEGVGSSRISYVSEMVKLLRATSRRQVEEIRLRKVETDELSRFVRFNLAGYWNADTEFNDNPLWVWNLAAEGTTIVSDNAWIPLIDNLQPTRVFLLRGGLESVIRPQALIDNSWPFWVPAAWRSYAAMDPRCYFSTTWCRWVKEVVVDKIKQKIRLALLQQKNAQPLVEINEFHVQYKIIIEKLLPISNNIYILTLLPLNGSIFPGSPGHFIKINSMLRKLSFDYKINLIDWYSDINIKLNTEELYYRDGFHPNINGSIFLARVLHRHLVKIGAV